MKTDRRDALALAEACRLGAYRPAHRSSEEQRQVRALLTVRDRRRGQRVAVVALARKLSGVLYAMWRDGSAYNPAELGGGRLGALDKVA